MARIHFGSHSKPIRVDKIPNGAAPLGTVRTLEVDYETNATLVDAIAADGEPYVYDGATLTRDGTPVAIAAEGPLGRIEKLYTAALVDFRAIADGTTSLAAGDVIPTLRRVCGAIVVLDRLAR